MLLVLQLFLFVRSYDIFLNERNHPCFLHTPKIPIGVLRILTIKDFLQNSFPEGVFIDFSHQKVISLEFFKSI